MTTPVNVRGIRVEIRGTVQGVGFRPWVYRVARELGVTGRVRNDPRGVSIEAFGDPATLVQLIERLRSGAPRPARVRRLSSGDIPVVAFSSFEIEASGADGDRALSIPPDLATCTDCTREIMDPANRRFGYPFTNCTHCGPRFSIATGVPYDRAATTMAPFAMCPECQREFTDVGDRRFHAQPNACPTCGPRLSLYTGRGEPLGGADPLRLVVDYLRRGDIVAIKGLGGFHLACDAELADAVANLRMRKHRDEKPFAVMVRDLAMARALAELTPDEEALLTSPEHPIVLCKRRPGGALSIEVAPDTPLLGLLLPYTPLHHLLMVAVERPLVMTSANLSEEPICSDNGEAMARLRDIADVILVHDRDIAVRCEDSVAQVIAHQPTLLRRARGYAPRPIALRHELLAPVLGCGAHLRNTFCLARGDLAYLGPHIGDLENVAALEHFESTITHLEHLLDIRPEIVAHDLHPAYLSTRYARTREDARLIAVQHHHAHVASAMAEHGLEGPVLGLAYDGTGYGTDGTTWGGELLCATFDGFERLGTFRPIPLAGGDLAIREVWRIAMALLVDAFGDDAPLEEFPLFDQVSPAARSIARQMIDKGVNSPLARGIGRYFDGIGALVLARPHARFEGQVAVAWNLVAAGESATYPYALHAGTALPEIDLRLLVHAVVADVRAGVPAPVISARFHATLIDASAELVRHAAARVGRLPVVLTGGAFQNQILAEGVMRALAADFDVYLHADVPPGDGGIALGQVLVADAVARGESR